MPDWLRILSSIALMAGAVLITWALVDMMIRKRTILAPADIPVAEEETSE